MRYVVWVDDREVSVSDVTWLEAVKIASDWILRGYTDVRVNRVLLADLSQMV